MIKNNKQILLTLIISLLISNSIFPFTSKPTAFISANAKNTTAVFTVSYKSYVCEQNVFKIIDITDKSNIFLLGTLHLNSSINLVIRGNYAYVIGQGGLIVINVSNSDNPYIEGFASIQGDCYDLALYGNYAYITSNDVTLKGLLNIVDISTASNPSFVSSNNVANIAQGIAYNNNHVFIADNDPGSPSLIIINVSNPLLPYTVFSYPLDGRPSGVDISTPGSNTYAHVTNGMGLRIIDVTYPSMPTFGGSVNGIAQSGDIVVNSNYDYITNGESGIKVVDASIISNPFITKSLFLFGNASRINYSNSYLYVASKYGGLKIINSASAPDIFEEAKYVFSLVGTEDMTTYSTYLYTVNQDGLNIFDTIYPKNIVGVGYLPINNDKSWGIALDQIGNYVFVTGESGALRKIDISNPYNPLLIGTDSSGTSLRRIVVQDSYAFVADYYFGLRIYDITPAQPVLFTSLSLAGNPFAIKLNGPYLYIACESGGMRIIDISNPSTPSEIGYYSPLNPVKDLDISGNYAYLALQNGGIDVVDITNPATPQFFNNYNSFDNPNTVNRITIFGQNAYVGNKILNITNPNGIFEIGTLPTIYKMTSYAFIDSYLYLGNSTLDFSGESMQTCNTELPIGPEIKYAFYIDENKNSVVDAMDKIVIKFDQEVNTESLTPSNFFLPNIGDSLGGAGFVGSENTDYPTEAVLELGATPNLTIDGTTSSIDVDQDISNIMMNSKRSQLTATDSGLRKENDSGIDIKYVFIPDAGQIIGQSGGYIGVQNSTNAAYTQHKLYIPAYSVTSDYTFNLEFPETHLNNFSSVKLTSSPLGVNFDSQNPAILTLEYLPESINYDAGYINKSLRIFQIVENPISVYNFILVQGIQTIDTVNHTISVNLTSLNPNSSITNGTFGTIPIILVDEDSIDIKQSGKPISVGVRLLRPEADPIPILQPRQDGTGLYKKHKIEFPGFVYDTGYTVTIRQAEVLERVGFPDQSGAIFTITSSPTNFPSTSVHITVEYIPSTDPNQTDVVTLNGELGSENSMKVVKRNPTTHNFEFLPGTHSVDTINHTVTINNVTDFLDSGYGTFGTVAENTSSAIGWDLFE